MTPPRKVKARDLIVVVAGGRFTRDRSAVWRAMDLAHRHKPLATLVHGGTPGAEALAAEWAHRLGLCVELCAGDWAGLQETAGLDRNMRLIRDHKPDGVIVFPGAVFGEDLAARARAANIPVWYPSRAIR